MFWLFMLLCCLQVDLCGGIVIVVVVVLNLQVILCQLVLIQLQLGVGLGFIVVVRQICIEMFGIEMQYFSVGVVQLVDCQEWLNLVVCIDVIVEQVQVYVVLQVIGGVVFDEGVVGFLYVIVGDVGIDQLYLWLQIQFVFI